MLSSSAYEVLVLCSHPVLSEALVAALRTSGVNASRFETSIDLREDKSRAVVVGPIAEGSAEARVAETLRGDITIVLDDGIEIRGAERLSATSTLQDVLISLQKMAGPDRGLSITPRHAQILQYVADGLSVQEAAQRLRITPKTVNNHLGAVYRRLGVDNLTQAVLAAIRAGLIDPSRRSEDASE